MRTASACGACCSKARPRRRRHRRIKPTSRSFAGPQSAESCRPQLKSKPVIPREEASRDIDEAIAYLLREGAPGAPLGFIDALERALRAHQPPPRVGFLALRERA